MTDFLPPEFQTTDEGQIQVIIPLRIKPHKQKSTPSIIGSAFSYEAGTVLYGNYNMEYLLPDGDRLRLIANHNKKSVQLMLFTHDTELLKFLPGEHDSSLVANIINQVNRYRIRSDSYKKPLSPEQQSKLAISMRCINSLRKLLKKERRLEIQDYHGKEALRREIITIIEQCRDDNRMIANNPIVSEGTLGSILYDAHKTAQHYQFNRVYAVSREDQMDFSKTAKTLNNKKTTPVFVWDSEIHVGHDSDELDDALRAICQYYHLTSAESLNDIPANRFSKLETFLRSLWLDGKDWINYLSIAEKPSHKTTVTHRGDGISITQITPYFKLKGLAQKGYASLNDLVFNLTESIIEPSQAKNFNDAKQILSECANGHWVIVAADKQIILRLQDKLIPINYFIKDQQFYPLPHGQDLYTLSQVSKRHLYLPERASLRLKGFFSRFPTFIQNFSKSISRFIVHDLHEEFFKHVHATHSREAIDEASPKLKQGPAVKKRNSLHAALENHGLLANGQTLGEFVKEQINSNPYVIARANHPPSPPMYENPLHRTLGVIRHIGDFFISTSERNPITGTLAEAAYLFGGGAILAPQALTKILLKLHLGGLIAGIEPVQKLAQIMSHGTTSEAISASVTLWQATVAGGNLDKFFVSAVTLLKDDPGEVAIIAALALSLGYGITKVIPPLGHEMGTFPYTNYAALGGKGGAAIYDTIMHPGDDWLLGTCKWVCKGFLTLGKLFTAPFVEGWYYGFKEGFINGWKKSVHLAKRLGIQIFAAFTDFFLALLTVPLLEVSSLAIHIPFRGLTDFLRIFFAVLGNFTAIGGLLIDIAERPSNSNFITEFHLSPLYGFTNPWQPIYKNQAANVAINCIRCLFIPPLQLIKNVLILPLIDSISLVTRLMLTVLNPLSRVLLFSSGVGLIGVGLVWDRSVGLLFSNSASALTHVCNWVDNQASDIKQYALSQLEVLRSELYYWAFAEEDLLAHKAVNDDEYYTQDPKRSELIPHSKSHCLLIHLLDNDKSSIITPNQPAPMHHDALFRGTKGKHFDSQITLKLT